MKKDNKQYFKVPDNYFEQLSTNIINTIEATDAEKYAVQPQPERKILKSKIYYAVSSVAAVAIAIFLIWPSLFSQSEQTTTKETVVSQVDYYQFIEVMQEDNISEDYWMTMLE